MTAENDSYYSSKITIYAPDPLDLVKLKKIGESERGTLRTFCVWCKSAYSLALDNCPNCGGPKHDHS